MDDRTRCTEADGLEAVWTMKNYRHIEIRRTRDTATGDVIEFAPGTDLAAAREQTAAAGPPSGIALPTRCGPNGYRATAIRNLRP